MTDWTSGYVADLEYSYGYFDELNPLRARLALLNSGFAPPACESACELGFGQGVSVNIHAAATGAQWWGSDFNPAHAAFARELAVASGSGARLVDEAFADFCTRQDLPDFDFIGLHGVWSWVSDQNRSVILDFIRRRLKPGGVVYISYNTLPGHTATVPLRQLLVRHAETMQAPGQALAPRIDAALEFAQRLFEQNPAFLAANPQIGARLERMLKEDRRYLAHEYFNRDWRPMPFGEVAQALGEAKLSFAGSAHHLDHVEVLNLTEGQGAFLRELPDALFRETVRDFMINQQFRRDYFIKGPRRLTALDLREIARRERFILTGRREAIALTATGPAGEVGLRQEIYEPVLDVLSDHRPRTFEEIEHACGAQVRTFAELLEALMVLIGKKDLAPAQSDDVIAKARPAARNLNQRLMASARSDQGIGALASPVTGGGIPVSRFEQLFLLARAQGWSSPADWGAFAWNCLTELDQRVIVGDQVLEGGEENLAELTRQAGAFAEERLAILSATGIA
jgi:SAM-dependent methyltransferase